MEAVAKLKQELLAELAVQYKNLITFLNNVPVNPQFKSYSFQNLDQGIMWMSKGIECIEILKQEAKLKELEANVSEDDNVEIIKEKSNAA